jgi:hypothetical protein
MRISTGISEISFLSPKAGPRAADKTYIWPVYDNGSVTPVQGIAKRTQSNITYIKPTPEEHLRLVEDMERSLQSGYTASGSAADGKGVVYAPGTFFDALA